MQFQIIADNIELRDEYKDILDSKLGAHIDRLLKDFDEEMREATVKISKREPIGEFTINFDMFLPGQEHLFAEKTNFDFTSTVVDLREALERQIDKYKGRFSSKSLKKINEVV
jgi:ribosome-associated translation inhibitor RaiA